MIYWLPFQLCLFIVLMSCQFYWFISSQSIAFSLCLCLVNFVDLYHLNKNITTWILSCHLWSRFCKTSLFWFCNFFFLDDLRICFCLNKHKPWLELFFKFNQYSLRPFQKALVGLNNLWIHWSSTEFSWVSMSKIPSPKESWAFVFFNFLFDQFWKSIYLTYVQKFGYENLTYNSFFFIPKRVALCLKYWFS